jgi:phage terminase small subunit
MKLTAKQKLFVEEYLFDLNATQAAARAGYSKKTAKQAGTENLSKPVIANAITLSMQQRSERIKIDADYVLKRFHELEAFNFAEIFNAEGEVKPINEWPESARRSITSFEVKEEWVGSGDQKKLTSTISKIRIESRVKALENIGKHIGFYPDANVKIDPGDSMTEMLDRIANSPMGSPQGRLANKACTQALTTA